MHWQHWGTVAAGNMTSFNGANDYTVKSSAFTRPPSLLVTISRLSTTPGTFASRNVTSFNGVNDNAFKVNLIHHPSADRVLGKLQLSFG